jgi:hypothetical protein
LIGSGKELYCLVVGISNMSIGMNLMTTKDIVAVEDPSYPNKNGEWLYNE